MVPLTQTEIVSLSEFELLQVIDDFFEFSDDLFQDFEHSEWNFAQKASEMKHNFDWIWVQSSHSYDYNTATTNFFKRNFDITELIDFIHRITQMGDFLYQRTSKPNIELICGYERYSMLRKKNTFLIYAFNLPLSQNKSLSI